MGKRGRRRQRQASTLPNRGSVDEAGSGAALRVHADRSGADASPDAEAVVAAISSGALDADLDRIAGAVSHRLRVRQAKRAAAVMTDIEVGTRVRINDTARPKYLHGAWATVTGFASRSVLIRLDRPLGRFVDGVVRCPPSVLDPAGPQ